MPEQLQILVVDDDPMNRSVTLLMLDQLGLRADAVNDGAQAFAAVSAVDYDVVLMDIQIPEMNGADTTRRIRSELPQGTQPFIIAMTASATVDAQISYLQAGMDDFLPKPFQMRELATALVEPSSRCARTFDSGPGNALDDHSGRPPPSVPTLQMIQGRIPATYDPAPLDTLTVDLGERGGDLRRELIQEFVHDDGDRRTAISAAGYDETGVALSLIAHSLQSVGATLGLMALADMATRIEVELRSGTEPIDLEIKTSELISQCLEATAALRTVLSDEGIPPETEVDETHF